MRDRRVRYTMRQVMGLVLLLALGLAAVRYAVTNWGTSEAIAVAPIALVTTNILAWFQRARWQVFWVGFGLCGWAYLTISLESPMPESLPTAWLLDGLHDRYCANHPLPTVDDGFDGVVSESRLRGRFRRAGQSVISLWLALLGGVAATILFPTRAENRGGPPPPEGSLLTPGWRETMSRGS